MEIETDRQRQRETVCWAFSFHWRERNRVQKPVENVSEAVAGVTESEKTQVQALGL